MKLPGSGSFRAPCSQVFDFHEHSIQHLVSLESRSAIAAGLALAAGVARVRKIEQTPFEAKGGDAGGGGNGGGGAVRIVWAGGARGTPSFPSTNVGP